MSSGSYENKDSTILPVRERLQFLQNSSIVIKINVNFASAHPLYFSQNSSAKIAYRNLCIGKYIDDWWLKESRKDIQRVFAIVHSHVKNCTENKRVWQMLIFSTQSRQYKIINYEGHIGKRGHVNENRERLIWAQARIETKLLEIAKMLGREQVTLHRLLKVL